MINILGKTLAFVHVALCILLMAVAIALYGGAVLVNATVTITNGAGIAKSAVSDGEGKYSITAF